METQTFSHEFAQTKPPVDSAILDLSLFVCFMDVCLLEVNFLNLYQAQWDGKLDTD